MKTLERSLGTTTREHEKEKQGLVATDRRKIAEMELDGQGLRQLVRMKTKELATGRVSDVAPHTHTPP